MSGQRFVNVGHTKNACGHIEILGFDTPGVSGTVELLVMESRGAGKRRKRADSLQNLPGIQRMTLHLCALIVRHRSSLFQYAR
jgi:hypothetical protein